MLKICDCRYFVYKVIYCITLLHFCVLFHISYANKLYCKAPGNGHLTLGSWGTYTQRENAETVS